MEEKKMSQKRISSVWLLPDALWERLDPLLPKYRVSRQGGRPRLPMRQIANGIFYVLRTGCQWKAAPREYGSGSTLHSYFQEWTKLGIFRKLWKAALREYDELKGIQWEWQSMDGAMTKSPLGGEKNREKPDRSRKTRCQAVRADRWTRRAAGRRHKRCQYP